MDDATALLSTVTGRDRPGLTSAFCDVLAQLGARIIDIEQVTIRDRLTLGILCSLGCEEETAREALTRCAADVGVTVEFKTLAAWRPSTVKARHYVTLLGQPLRAG